MPNACKECSHELNASNSLPGRRVCRACVALHDRARHASRSPDSACARKARMAAWAKENAEAISARKRAWYLAHLKERASYNASCKERRAARDAAWQRDNHARRSAYKRIRVAAKRSTASELSSKEWLDVVESFNGACAYCLRTDVKVTIDHIQALSRGGTHDVQNVVPACVSCNASKGSRGILRMVNRLAA